MMLSQSAKARTVVTHSGYQPASMNLVRTEPLPNLPSHDYTSQASLTIPIPSRVQRCLPSQAQTEVHASIFRLLRDYCRLLDLSHAKRDLFHVSCLPTQDSSS